MKITFNLKCHTRYGENMFLVFDGKEMSMRYTNDFVWQFEIETNCEITHTYKYVLRCNDETTDDAVKCRYTPIAKESFVINDSFYSVDVTRIFDTKVFDVLMPHSYNASHLKFSKGKFLVAVYLHGVETNEKLVITGAMPILGRWKAERGLELKAVASGVWCMALEADLALSHTEFKVVKIGADGRVAWEEGENHLFPVVRANEVYSVKPFFTPTFHGRGVAIPLFSLRAKDDWGVGDISLLPKFAKDIKKQGLSLIQLLPINDTTICGSAADSYPYRAVSVHALHPIYLNVLQAGILNNKAKMKCFMAKARRLNALHSLRYADVYALKISYMRLLYAQELKSLQSDIDYKKFVEENEAIWLRDYAAFSLLNILFANKGTRDWGDYAKYDEAKVEHFCLEHPNEIQFYYFVQYHLDKQLRRAVDEMHEIGVVLKGDLPIGVGRHSVEAWKYSSLFYLQRSAGAPPDQFSEIGQNWGFPTYNWHAMQADNYKWWRERFARMERYFDAFRIDHVLGFFRIWEMPESAIDGTLGRFSPAKPLSINEIESYGLTFDYERFTQPYITEAFLKLKFAENSEKIAKRFLVCKKLGNFAFKDQYATQALLKAAWTGELRDEITEEEYRLLLDIQSDVLFLCDLSEPSKYHPRINYSSTYSYAMMAEEDKKRLKALHNEYFYYRHNCFWRDEGYKKLQTLVKTTNMMVCAEDLGMVPDCVPEVLNDLKILSLEVERMPKRLGAAFTDMGEVPYLSVVCTGTHDTSTLRGWWLENPAITQSYYESVLGCQGRAPEEISPQLAQRIVDSMCKSKSMWAILPWQDLYLASGAVSTQTPEEERINVPSNPEHVWQWRMPIEISVD